MEKERDHLSDPVEGRGAAVPQARDGERAASAFRTEQLLKTLNDATLAIQKTLTPGEIFEAAGDCLDRAGIRCVIFLMDKDDRVFPAYFNFHNRAMDALNNLLGITIEEYSAPIENVGILKDAIRTRQVVYSSEARNVVHQMLPDHLKKFTRQVVTVLKITNIVAAPLILEEDIVGILTLIGDDLAAGDVSAVMSFAYQIAAAWRRTSLVQELEIKLVERKRAEDQFRSIFENAVMGLYRTTPSGEILMANPALIRMLGYDCLESLTRRNLETDGFSESFPRQEFKERIENDGQIRGVESAWKTRQGDMIFVRESASAIQDETGEVIYYEGTVEDITERKMVEAEREKLLLNLERRNTQLQTAAQISKFANTILDPNTLIQQSVTLIQDRFGFYYVGLFMADESGEFAILRAGTGIAGQQMLSANYRLQIEETSMIGWCIVNVQPRIALDVGQDAVRFENPYLPETRSEIALPLISRRRCTGALTVQSTRETAFSEEDIIVLRVMAEQLAIAIDNARLYETAQREIAERSLAEDEIRKLNKELEQRVTARTAELEAANKELEAFAYSVSHDLRTPLRGIDGFSQALLEDYGDILDHEGKDYLNRVRRGTQKMGELIDDILKLSRITRHETRIRPIDMTAVVREITDRFKAAEPERKIRFEIAEHIEARGDPHLVRIALENLLNNAVKYSSKKRRAKVEFGVELLDDQEVFFIRDNGAGFNMEYADKLFAPFQRLHNIHEFPGSGVGLSIVQRIITKHNGRIWAESEEAKGAVFFFTLG